jgi:hypothetical protein
VKKLTDLRTWLLSSVRELQKHPEKLQLFVDRGNLHARLTNYDNNLSYEYQFDLNLIVTDYSVDPDNLMVPLLAWVKANQTDLAADAIQFEADIIDHKRIDLSITLPLTERVIVTQGEDGNYTTEHLSEPVPEWNLPDPVLFLELWHHDEKLTPDE